MKEAEEDPDLAAAIRMSIEIPQQPSTPDSSAKPTVSSPPSTSVPTSAEPTPMESDVLSEEEQLELAIKLSMAAQKVEEASKREAKPEPSKESKSEPKGTPPASTAKAEEISDVMADSEFVNSVLKSLPGVNLDDPQIKSILAELRGPQTTTAQTVPYAELRTKPAHLDRHKLETYLSEQEFTTVFGMSREEFDRMPKDRQDKVKKEKDLL